MKIQKRGTPKPISRAPTSVNAVEPVPTRTLLIAVNTAVILVGGGGRAPRNEVSGRALQRAGAGPARGRSPTPPQPRPARGSPASDRASPHRCDRGSLP